MLVVKNILKIAICSLNVAWQNKAKNFAEIESLTQAVNADIILLPEMFATGFSMDPVKIAEAADGESISFMKRLANKHDAAVCGSVAYKEKADYCNRLFWVSPDGACQYYDKRHLFSYAHEDQFYSSGKTKLIVEYAGWKLCPLICYDLRFPVWSRNVENYDLLIYIANWPAAREDSWRTLLKARAIENMAFTAGVNRSGKDGNNLQYSGFSTVFDGLGKTCAHQSLNPSVDIFSLDKSVLAKQRLHYGFLNDRDDFTVAG